MERQKTRNWNKLRSTKILHETYLSERREYINNEDVFYIYLLIK